MVSRCSFGNVLALDHCMTIKKEEEEWRELCDLIANEQDPQHLCDLVDQLIKAMDNRKQSPRSGGKKSNTASSSSKSDT